MDEFGIIDKYFLPLTNNCQEAANLKDDTARISIDKQQQLIVSKDLIVEDIHFKRSHGAYNIAARLLKINLSDLAASAACPLYYMIGFSKTKDIDEKFIADFCLGLKETADQYQLSLIGGDSVAANDKLFFSLTIFGQSKKGHNLSRSNAQKGELIFTSGFIGDAFLGLQITQNQLKSISKEHKEYLLSRYYSPTPRIALSIKLLENKLANAAIDISDGLLADLNHICKASNLGAVIYQKQIPISFQAKTSLKSNDNLSFTDLITGGDDYELIFTAPKENKEKIINIAQEINVLVTPVGYLENNQKRVRVIDSSNQEIKILKYGYQHY